jgi:hypothetical protein
MLRCDLSPPHSILPTTGSHVPTLSVEIVDVAKKSPPQLVIAAACALFGDQWKSRTAQTLDLHPRTIRRIGQAARTGEPFPVSPGVLVELAGLSRECAAAIQRGNVDDYRRARRLDLIALELDEAARTWSPTRRLRKVS